MVAFLIIGGILTAGGLGGVLWCIRKAAWLRKADLDETAVQAELRKLIIGHMASIGAAFFGLGLLFTGFLLG